MRKVLTLFLCLTLVLGIFSVFASASSASKFTPGTYTAAGPGRSGDIVVEMTFDENSILSAKVIESEETLNIGTQGLDIMCETIVEKQCVPDIVSGATQSSAGMRVAVSDIIKQAGGDPADMKQPVEEITDPVVTCDVVIAGSGGGAINTAVELREKGYNVILVEKMGILGGTSLTASVSIPGYGSSVHKEQGIEYTTEDFYTNNVSARLKEADDTIARRYAEIIPEMIDKLLGYGADIVKVNGTTSMVPSDNGTVGNRLIPYITKHAREIGVDIRTNTKAVKILMDGDNACGLVVEAAGGTYEIHAKAVVIGTGGYFNDKSFVEKYSPQYAAYGHTWAKGSDGDGLYMVMDVGGYLDEDSMSKPTINPTGYVVSPHTELMSFTPIRSYGAILVGASTGTRFANENGDYTVAAANMPDSKAYAIFDQKVYENSVTFEEYYHHGYFMKADTIEELAGLLDLDPQVLAGTIETYAGYAHEGNDAEFGRTSFGSDLLQPPYYACPVEPALHSAYGGVACNARGQALRLSDDEPIPGLYVVGNVADNSLLPGSLSAVTYAGVLAECIDEDLA